VVIDFHAHILPGADHGSKGREVTQEQLRLIAAAGTDIVVATPHFYPHRDNLAAFLARRSAALGELANCKAPAMLQILVGAEVQVCEGLEELEELETLCVQGTSVILLEMPHGPWSSRLTDTVSAIQERGLFPVLAHIDRYDEKRLEPLLQQGIAAQLNAEAFEGFFARRRAVRLLRRGCVVALGSDLHGAKAEGYDAFLRMRARLGADAEKIFAQTADLLKNAENYTRLPGKSSF
jgi:protein-tyrosine phosphatase